MRCVRWGDLSLSLSMTAAEGWSGGKYADIFRCDAIANRHRALRSRSCASHSAIKCRMKVRRGGDGGAFVL